MITRVLIIRFSALGDISMTLPVIESVCKTYPKVQFTFLTSKMGASIAETVLSLDNLKVIGVNPKKDYNGISGLNRLYKEISADGFDAVADLHDVLRTKYIRSRFLLAGKKVASIDKGRSEKKALVEHKINRQLKSTFVRYQEVFKNLGLNSEITYNPFELQKKYRNKSDDSYNVGIAPFAQHEGKQYPLNLMGNVIRQLVSNPHVHIFLYGSVEEKLYLEKWKEEFRGRITNYAGAQSISEDVKSMANLDVMLTMDSSNMHLASLVGIRCVSIWGNTHPYAGFLGFNQKMEDVIQLDIPCRPCSVYGKGDCKFGDYGCMNDIKPDIVVEKI